MSYEVIKKGDTVWEVKVTVEPEKVKKAVSKIVSQIRKTAKIPGFRPGKAPDNMIKRFFQEDIRQRVIQELLPPEIEEVVSKENLQLLVEPGVRGVEFSEPEGKLSCVAVLEVKPEIELKPEDYKGIKVKKVVREITDKDVERVIESLRNSRAKFIDVDREAKEGDLVEIEYELQVEDAEPIKNKIAVILGEGQLWPELEGEIIGKKRSEEGELAFKAPEDKNLYGEAAGKNVKVKFKVNQVKQKQLPELNDEFAKLFGAENLDKLRENIRKDLENSEKERQQEEVEDAIIEEILKKVKIPVPPSMLDLEIRAQMENETARMASMGIDPKQISPQTLIQMVAPSAEKTVKVKLLLEKIAELEGIEVSEEDIEKEIERLARIAFNGDTTLARNSLEQRGLMPMVKKDVLRQKALDRLIELAEVEEVKQESQEENQQKQEEN